MSFGKVAQSCPTLCDPMDYNSSLNSPGQILEWVQFIQSLSRVQLCNLMDCNTPGLPVHHQLPESTKLTSIELVTPSNHLIPCRPLLLLPSIFPSIRVFSNELDLCIIRWPKYWNFSISINLSSEFSGLISFRIDWFDLLVVQGTLKSRRPQCTPIGF